MNELKGYESQMRDLDIVHEKMSKIITFREKRYGILNGTDQTLKLQEELIKLDNWYGEQKDLSQAMAQYDWEKDIE